MLYILLMRSTISEQRKLLDFEIQVLKFKLKIEI